MNNKLDLLGVFIIYAIPTLIASFRHHKHTIGIAAINILLGWTVFGWLCVLIWSIADEHT